MRPRTPSHPSLGEKRLATEIDAGRSVDGAAAFAVILDEPSLSAAEKVVRGSGLSTRELEVAALVAEGLGNRAIAERLFLSPRTVAKHVEHVMNKLGVDSRAAIASWHAKSAPARR